MKKLILTIAATLLMANAFCFGPGYKFEKQPIDDVPLTYEDICIQAELDELENNLPSYWRESLAVIWSFCSENGYGLTYRAFKDLVLNPTELSMNIEAETAKLMKLASM